MPVLKMTNLLDHKEWPAQVSLLTVTPHTEGVTSPVISYYIEGHVKTSTPRKRTYLVEEFRIQISLTATRMNVSMQKGIEER